MPSRAQIMLMAVGFRKKPIENMMSVWFDPAKQSCIGIFYELSTPPVTHLFLRCLHVSFIISQNHGSRSCRWGAIPSFPSRPLLPLPSPHPPFSFPSPPFPPLSRRTCCLSKVLTLLKQQVISINRFRYN